MNRTDKLLIILLLVTAVYPMLYNRQRSRWSSIFKSKTFPSSSRSSPSPSLLKMRQNLDAIKYIHRPPAHKTCRVEAVLLKLQPPLRYARSCKPIHVHTFGCRGGCSSYSRVDPRNSTHILHSCTCCQPLRFMASIAELPCTNGRHIRVPVKKVLGCSCRPCYSENGTSDIITLRDLLTKAAVNTPFPIG